jgi:hypothetical protein
MRRDIHVPNESDALVITSSSMRARGIAPGDPGWVEAVTACDLLPLSVESEDPANVGIVVGEPLDASEQREWVGVVRSALRIPDGRLALCGGIAYVLDREAWAEEYAYEGEPDSFPLGIPTVNLQGAEEDGDELPPAPGFVNVAPANLQS